MTWWQQARYTQPVHLKLQPTSVEEGIVLRSVLRAGSFLDLYTSDNPIDGLVSATSPVTVGYLLLGSSWTVSSSDDTTLILTAELPIHSGISDIQYHPEHTQYCAHPVLDNVGDVFGYYFKVFQSEPDQHLPTIDRYTDLVIEYDAQNNGTDLKQIRSSSKRNGLHRALTIVPNSKMSSVQEQYSLKELLMLHVRYVQL